MKTTIVNYLPCCYLNVDWKNEINTEMRLDANESSIFVSILWMAGIICSPLGDVLSCWLGRKKVVMIAAPFVAVGWLVIGFAQNKVMLLYIGRILSGGRIKILPYRSYIPMVSTHLNSRVQCLVHVIWTENRMSKLVLNVKYLLLYLF